MRSSHYLYVILAVAAAVWWLAGLGSDDEAAILSELDRMAELIKKEPGEKALEAADRARRLADHFTSDFEVELRPVGARVTNTAELARPFVGLRRQAQELSVSFEVEELEISEDFPTATMSAAASLTGTVNGPRESATYRVLFAWKRQGGDWKIESLQVTERIEGDLF